MSKSNQLNLSSTQAPRRHSRTLDLKPLDFERRFIDDLIATDDAIIRKGDSLK